MPPSLALFVTVSYSFIHIVSASSIWTETFSSDGSVSLLKWGLSFLGLLKQEIGAARCASSPNSLAGALKNPTGMLASCILRVGTLFAAASSIVDCWSLYTTHVELDCERTFASVDVSGPSYNDPRTDMLEVLTFSLVLVRKFLSLSSRWVPMFGGPQ